HRVIDDLLSATLAKALLFASQTEPGDVPGDHPGAEIHLTLGIPADCHAFVSNAVKKDRRAELKLFLHRRKIINSVRRLRLRPSSVSLSATGRRSPKPR